MSKFILLKRLHFVKAINAIIALSLQKSKTGPWKVPGQNVIFALVSRWVAGKRSRLSPMPRWSQRIWCLKWLWKYGFSSFWNALPANNVSATSLAMFKARLNGLDLSKFAVLF